MININESKEKFKKHTLHEVIFYKLFWKPSAPLTAAI